MHNFSSFLRRAGYFTLATGLLGAGGAAAQTTAQVYVLINQVPTAGGTAVVAAAQSLNTLNISYGPASANDPTPTVTGTGFVTTAPKPLSGLTTATGLSAAQVIVAIDTRPNTGQLYALGYDATKAYDATQTSKNAQLYTLNPTNGQLTAVGPGFSVDLQDTNRANTKGFLPNVGFDFNPRADRLRIVGPNRTDYRVNPNTGTLAVVDGTLTYASGSRIPYVGSVAYTNSLPGVPGTTLYDLDISAGTNAMLAIQAPPNDGTLTSQGQLTFQVNSATTYAQLASPVIGLDLDILYQNGQNVPLLLEARFSAEDNTTQSQGYASNLYVLNTSNGQAKGNNLFGRSSSFISNIAAVTGPQKLWNGTVSTDWATAGNWTPAVVPTSTDNVVIPGPGGAVAFQPTLASTQQVGSLVLIAGLNNSTSVVTLADGSNLQVFGDFTNNDGALATPSGAAGTGTVTLAGARAQEIGGPTATTFPNLAVGAGTTATTSAGVTIARSVTATGNLTIGAGQVFTLRSNASGTAYVVNNGGAVTGTATVQRYITPTNNGPGYRHYSSPVSGNTVADFATASYSPVVNAAYNSANNPRQTSPYPTVFFYDQSRLATSNAAYAVGDFDNGFLSPSALSDALVTGRGYTVNIGGSELVDFQGTLNQASSYARTGLARGAQATAGYQLLGNPYPSALNYDALITNTTGMESALYVYKSSGQYTGTYTTYVPAGATNGGPGMSANGGTSNIPVAQGFFMRTAPGQTGSVTFTTAARSQAPETAAFQRTASTLPTLALTLSGNGVANQTRVYFDQQATPAFDAKYDAHYLPATHGLDLASDISTEALAINGLPELTGATTVALRVHAPTAGTYTLAVDELVNLPAGYRTYLRDASTGTYTDLTTTPSVSLTLAPGEAPTGRFALLFAAASPLATAPAALAALATVYPSPAHGTATLVLPQALRGNSASTVQLLNLLGQVVLTKTVAAGSSPTIELPLAGIAAGIYTVRATTEAGLVAKRLVVQ
ncbi:MAG: DUF4394 domain-containing protein [Janthinobacterium lividum]